MGITTHFVGHAAPYTHGCFLRYDIGEQTWWSRIQPAVQSAVNSIRDMTNAPITFEMDETHIRLAEPHATQQRTGTEPICVYRTTSATTTNSELSDSFCDTKGSQPFDRLVVALLCILQYHTPNNWRLYSDGTHDDWDAGRRLAADAVGEGTHNIHNVPLPDRIAS